MKRFYFVCAYFFSFLAISNAAGNEKPGCLEREKALTLLETAKDLLSKARDTFPSCNKDLNSTEESECDCAKPLAYIAISEKLISDVRKHFPTCSKPIEKDDKIVQDFKPRDCSEILASGRNESGIYTIWSEESFTSGKSLQVYCDMETEDGGWTVIQRRGKYPVQQDFYQNWDAYKNGFGNLTEEFWLGNENIRALCHEGCEIRFDLEDEDGENGFALYQNFNLTSDKYILNIGGYTGNVGDGMQHQNDNPFSTKDKGDTWRAGYHQSGWWHVHGGYHCNLNGFYQPGETNFRTVFWYTWREFKNLASAEMKVRPK